MSINWQDIEHSFKRKTDAGMSPSFRLARAKIPGGWLVVFFAIRTEDYNPGFSPDTTEMWAAGFGGMTFVPDPGHSWDGNSLP
jgi:hypothetical protein